MRSGWSSATSARARCTRSRPRSPSTTAPWPRNDGEGGIIALVALVQRSTRRVAVNTAVLVGLGIFGASLFYGDSVITPAISVLSAVEGLKVAAPELADLVVPIALAVLTALFAIQRLGTHVVGRLFGPVVLLWFAAIAAAGLLEVAVHPDAL